MKVFQAINRALFSIAAVIVGIPIGAALLCILAMLGTLALPFWLWDSFCAKQREGMARTIFGPGEKDIYFEELAKSKAAQQIEKAN